MLLRCESLEPPMSNGKLILVPRSPTDCTNFSGPAETIRDRQIASSSRCRLIASVTKTRR
jgi:hypothetical protein